MEAGSNSKITGLRGHVLSVRYHDMRCLQNPWLQGSCLSHGESRRRQVGRGWPTEGVRQCPGVVGAGRRVLTGTKACFLDGFVEDVGNCIVPSVKCTVPFCCDGKIRGHGRRAADENVSGRAHRRGADRVVNHSSTGMYASELPGQGSVVRPSVEAGQGKSDAAARGEHGKHPDHDGPNAAHAGEPT